MLRLALLRHAEAHAHASGGDRDRTLTASGKDMARKIGAYCAAMPLLPDIVLVSPSSRTQGTYEFAAKEMKAVPPAHLDDDLYNATSTTIKGLVATLPSECKTVLVIGHNPGIAEAAIALAGDGDRTSLSEMRQHFPAPALAVIDFDIAVWAEIKAGQGLLKRFVTKSML